MLELWRTEPVNIDVRISFSDVPQEIDVPLERQFRMMPALHQDLHSACGSELVQLLIKLLEAEHVMIFVALGSIKRAEFAVHVADVRVVNIAIDDIRHDV